MKLSSVILVNWYLFDPVTIPIRGNVALIGENGAGKSTIIDAIQTVLFGGNQKSIKLNSSASISKTNRSIRTYCLGYYKPGNKDDESSTSFRKRDESITYLGLVFENPLTSTYISVFVGIEAYENDPSPDFKIRGVYEGNRPLNSRDFINVDEDGSYESMTPLDLKKSLSLQGIEPFYADKSKDFMEEMVKLIGPRATQDWIDPEVLRTSLSKSISLKKEITEVSQFVENFVLEPRDIKVDDLIRTKNHYQELTKKINELSEQKGQLEDLKSSLKRLINRRKKMHSLHWILIEKKLDANRTDFYDWDERLKQGIKDIWNNKKSLHEAKRILSALDEESQNLALQINSDDDQKRKKDLDLQIKGIKKDIQEIQMEMGKEILSFQNFCQSNIDALKEESLNILLSKMRSMCERIQDSSFDFKGFDEITEQLLERLDFISTLIETKRKPLYARACEIDGRITELTESIDLVSSGKRVLSKETEFLIHYLSEHGIQATPVCNVVEISDTSWQAAIEAFLANNVEALIVPEDQEDEAILLYRNLKRTHKIFNRVIVKASLCLNWFNNIPIPNNSAASLLVSDNRYALGFLYKILGNLELVSTESELKRSKFALSKDGMIANAVGVSRRKLSSYLKMMKDQSVNLNAWQKERDGLNKEKEKIINPQLKGISNVSDAIVLLKEIRTKADRTSFESRNDKVQGLEIARSKKEEILDSIDLTHIETLVQRLKLLKKAELPRRTKEKEELIRAIEKLLGQARQARKLLVSLDDSIDRLNSSQVDIEHNPYFDAQFNDSLQAELEEKEPDQVETEYQSAKENFSISIKDQGRKTEEISQSDSDFRPEEHLPLCNETLVPLVQYVDDCIKNIIEMNILEYQEAANKASRDLSESFRKDVINRLREVFESQNRKFRALNKALSQRLFHSERYKFIKKPKVEFKHLIEYIEKTAKEELSTGSDDLFNVMPVEVEDQIELLISSDKDDAMNIRDYRKYFTYDVEVSSEKTGDKYNVSDQMGTGSGGEKQSPFYVAIASSLASAWGTLTNPGKSAGLALLDEAFDKLDEENLKNAMSFMNDTGLQVIVATPAQQEYVFKPAVNSVIYVSKHILSNSDATASLDIEILTEKGWEIFNLPEIIPNQSIENG